MFKKLVAVTLILTCSFRLSLIAKNVAFAEVKFPETGVECESVCFIEHSDLFTYLALTNLWEIDSGDNVALDYPGYEHSYLAGILEGGKLALIQDDSLLITDLYQSSETIALTEENFVMCMAAYNGSVYYFTSDHTLHKINIATRESEILLRDVWVRFMLTDDSGLWFSDDTGLYLLRHGSDAASMVIDRDVGYFQILSNDIYYASASSGEVWKFSLESSEFSQVMEKSVYSFVFDETGTIALVISRPARSLYRYDANTDEYRQITLPAGESPLAFNISNSSLYLCVTGSKHNANMQDLQSVYCYKDDALVSVYSEEAE